MSITSILSSTGHRSEAPPTRAWIMFQRWHDLCFAHWPLAPEELRPLVPPAFELDLFERRAWIGVVPFRMSGIRLRGTPPVPGIAAFEELNVRTYVRHAGRAGVFFFSLDAKSRIAVEVARRWFHLPYFHARMELERDEAAIRYRSRRTHRGAEPAELEMEYEPVGPVYSAEPETLEHFLTERYVLLTTGARGEAIAGEVHHPPWPLQPARARIQANTMARAGGVRLPDGEPHLLFARRLDVVIWSPERV